MVAHLWISMPLMSAANTEQEVAIFWWIMVKLSLIVAYTLQHGCKYMRELYHMKAV